VLALVDDGQQTPTAYSEPADVLALLDGTLGPLEILGEWPTGEVPPRACRRWLTRGEAAAERRAARKQTAAEPTQRVS
jgi:hypothetical protein